MTHDLVAMGRISVDIYPQDIGVSLGEVNTFGKYLGGSPTNVAVAAARHGRNTAVITRTGADPFGDYLRTELQRYGVDPRWVTAVEGLQTPVTFCAIQPPEDFPLYFYGRTPTAPDWAINSQELDLDAVRQARLFWSTVTGLAQEPSRAAQIEAHRARPRENLAEGQHTILDLDHRPMFWDSEDHAREEVAKILPYVTVAIGNEAECAVAVGHGTPDEQADRLLEAGVQIAVVKLGSQGVMAATRDQRVVSAPLPVDTVNGLGAGDSFGGAFCHGLLAGWGLEETLDFANACGAIVASRIACSEAMPTTQEAMDMLRDRGRGAPAENGVGG